VWKIAVVDDEKKLAEMVADRLRKELNIPVDIFYNSTDFLERLNREDYRLVILDVVLPDIDGYETCKIVKERKPTIYVILLTVLSDDKNVVEGFESGADDYVSKPFSMDVLLARVKRFLFKRKEEILDFGDIKIEVSSRKVLVEGKEVNLSKKEFDLLLILAMNEGRVFTREKLLDLVWSEEIDVSPRVVDTTVKRLRKKIEKDPNTPKHVKTVWGIGYKFVKE